MPDVVDPILLRFMLTYLVILAVPGPNMLAVAGLAALRGVGATLPVSVGLACGVATLALLMYGTVLAAQPHQWCRTMHFAGAGALAMLGVQVGIRRAVAGTVPRCRGVAFGFAGGFCTAAFNPVSATFLATQFAGPLTAPGTAKAAILCVGCMSLLVSLGVAALLARPALQRLFLQWHRPVRLGVAGALVLLAAATACAVARVCA